jgi:large subunit ribosomal protein L25
VLKDSHRDPVRGDVLHVDLLRVDLNKPIEAQVTVHLVGVDEAPGVKEGGVLEHVTREITVEALPNDIPETIEHDVSHMEMLATELLSAVTAPPNVIFKDDLEETVIASVTPPRVEEEPEEIEEETALVGEDGEPIAEAEGAEAEGEGGEEPSEDAGSGEE